jgi:hypothetical protein
MPMRLPFLLVAIVAFGISFVAWKGPELRSRSSASSPADRSLAEGVGSAPPSRRAPSRPESGAPVARGGELEASRTEKTDGRGAVGSKTGPSTPERTAKSAAMTVGGEEDRPSARSAEAIALRLSADDLQNPVAPLARLYLAYFNRFPDYQGLRYYATERERGLSLDSISDDFAASREFELRYGRLDNATFLDRIFEHVTDPGQRAFWLAQLDSGTMTRGQVVLAFSESVDFRTVTSNEVFVVLAYAELLGRAPEQQEFRRWLNHLDGGNARSAFIEALEATRRGR